MKHTHTALFGGEGIVEVVDVLGGVAAGSITALLRCQLAAGASIGRHRQEDFDAVFVCLAGQGRAVVDDVPRAFSPDDALVLPLGTSLSLHNESDTDPLDYMIAKSATPQD